jgi:hypothetical protein
MDQGRLKRVWLRIALWSLPVALAAVAFPGLIPDYHTVVDRSMPGTLRTIATAQEDFRRKDLDEDGIRQFWREDIAGLYTLMPKRNPTVLPLRLIELSTAAADERCRSDIERYAVKAAKAGYWYRAIRHRDEKPLSPDRFAVVCFPEVYSKQLTLTYVLDERGIIYRSDLGHGHGLEIFPTEDELRLKWSKLD